MKASLLASALALPLLAFPAIASAQSDPAPLTAQDLVTLPRLGAPATNADGTLAVYSVTTTDPESYERDSAVYLMNLSAASPAPVKLDLGGSASSLQFGGDGWLYFLSDRSAGKADDGSRSRLWRARVTPAGRVGSIALVSDVPGEIADYKLSPDASRVVFLGEFARSCATFGCADEATHLPGPGTGRLYDGDGGFYRHWDQWETPGVLARAFAFPIENGRTLGPGVPIDGPDGEGALIGDVPTKPFGGSEELAWDADSSGIYFAARAADRAEPSSTNVDIYRTDFTSGQVRNLTANNLATDTLPAPSPDGRWLAYAAMARPNYESDRMVIHLLDRSTGETRALTQDFDRSFHSIAWTPDSRSIIATAGDVLDDPAFRIDPMTGAVTRLDLVPGNEAAIGSVTPLPGDRLLFTRSSVANPSELYLATGYANAVRLTDTAYSAVQGMGQVETRRFKFTGADGDDVWGMIHKPAWTDAKLPVVLYVHGGPQGSFSDGWSSRWNPRVVASQGYAVVSVDFHGSTGYGQAFTDSINRDWGGKPLEDLQLGLAAALSADPQIDGDRACAMGASYGGYMMNWIAGNWPDRFDCLVQHDGLFDMRSFYYTTEELWFPKWDFGGSYAENSELYERWNPVNFVGEWKTPMLVVTGERDFRVPYTQGLASFTALQERGIPSQLLVFPDENHWVLKPKNSLQWHATVFDWLDRWLKE